MPTKMTYLERLGGHRLYIAFNDGSGGDHDFCSLMKEPGPLLEPLSEEAFFSRVFVDFGAPTWPNGFDIAIGMATPEMAAAGELTRVAAE